MMMKTEEEVKARLEDAKLEEREERAKGNKQFAVHREIEQYTLRWVLE